MSPDKNNRISNDRTEKHIAGQPTTLKPWTAPRLLKQTDCNGKALSNPTEASFAVGPS
jgi:hypothetical protein